MMMIMMVGDDHDNGGQESIYDHDGAVTMIIEDKLDSCCACIVFP